MQLSCDPTSTSTNSDARLHIKNHIIDMTSHVSLETGDQEHYSNADKRAAGTLGNINTAAYSMIPSLPESHT
jgi:hypothetical protein